jgi:hypothetical protein
MLYIKLKHKNKTDIEISVTTQNVVVDILFEFFFFKKKKNETHINEDKCATPIKLSLITNNDGVTTTTYRH